MTTYILPYESEAAWIAGAAEQIARRLRAALAARRRATLVLSGGNTPRPVYRVLAERHDIDWREVHFFWGDERTVPPDDPQSNFGMAREALLQPLGIADDDPRVHRLRGEAAPEEAARAAERDLQRTFDLAPGEAPPFDVVLLGMGDDGHTASLFPGTPALEAGEGALVVANAVPQQETTRLTMTFLAFSEARAVLFLVRGEDKAARLAEVLGDGASEAPIRCIQPRGETLWLLDEAAAADLDVEGE